MGALKKFTHAAVCNQLRHCQREIEHDANNDIEPNLSKENEILTPIREGQSAFDYYKSRKSDLYVYKRDDVKTLAQWVFTCPKNLTTVEEQKEFLKITYNFLEERYGKENVVLCTTHFDEGKREVVKNRFTDKVLLDNNENQIKNLIVGSPHLHFNFIPVARDNNPKHKQREKICSNDVLTKQDLKTIHKDLNKYILENSSLQCDVNSGITKTNGRNYTVEELKERYELNKELERLREIERKYNLEHELEKGGRWD